MTLKSNDVVMCQEDVDALDRRIEALEDERDRYRGALEAVVALDEGPIRTRATLIAVDALRGSP